MNMTDNIIIPNFCLEDPIKDMNKWPAIMLAVNRIANVIGRILSLIVAIVTMNGIKI